MNTCNISLMKPSIWLNSHRTSTKTRFFKMKRAFVRSIEIMGEAVKQIPQSICQEHPEIEWRAMTGMRDRSIHGYFGVDYDIVWDVVTNKIPGLTETIRQMLDEDIH